MALSWATAGMMKPQAGFRRLKVYPPLKVSPSHAAPRAISFYSARFVNSVRDPNSILYTPILNLEDCR
jgi:hypothetical protein